MKELREAALERAMQRAFMSDAESRTNAEYITEIFDAGYEAGNNLRQAAKVLVEKWEVERLNIGARYAITQKVNPSFEYTGIPCDGEITALREALEGESR